MCSLNYNNFQGVHHFAYSASWSIHIIFSSHICSHFVPSNSNNFKQKTRLEDSVSFLDCSSQKIYDVTITWCASDWLDPAFDLILTCHRFPKQGSYGAATAIGSYAMKTCMSLNENNDSQGYYQIFGIWSHSYVEDGVMLRKLIWNMQSFSFEIHVFISWFYPPSGCKIYVNRMSKLNY